MNNYKLEIYKAPLEAIRRGLKKVEIRTNNSYESIEYDKLVCGDTISFQVISGPPFIGLDIVEPDALTVEVVEVRHYPNPETLLEHEKNTGLESFIDSKQEMVELLYSFHEYREMLPIHGIFAIEIKVLD